MIERGVTNLRLGKCHYHRVSFWNDIAAFNFGEIDTGGNFAYCQKQHFAIGQYGMNLFLFNNVFHGVFNQFEFAHAGNLLYHTRFGNLGTGGGKLMFDVKKQEHQETGYHYRCDEYECYSVAVSGHRVVDWVELVN